MSKDAKNILYEIKMNKETGWDSPLSSVEKITRSLNEYGIAYVRVGAHKGPGSDKHRENVRQILERDCYSPSVFLIGPSTVPHHESNAVVVYATFPTGSTNKDFSILLKDSY